MDLFCWSEINLVFLIIFYKPGGFRILGPVQSSQTDPALPLPVSCHMVVLKRRLVHKEEEDAHQSIQVTWDK